MSWYISVSGVPAGVAREFAAQAARNKCVEPEESIKNAVAAIVAQACAGTVLGNAIKVVASGSQYTGPDGKAISNNLKVDIEPLTGFVTE